MHQPVRGLRRALARVGVLALLTSLPVLAITQAAPAAAPVTKAVSTTTNINASTGNGACLNGQAGQDPTNCNAYESKQDVWLSGLPDSAHLADGTYFFAILAPGGQPNPNDNGPGNLSDDVDLYTNRTFTMNGGTIGYAGTHGFELNKLQAFDFADTPNPGGVYILAVCKISAPNSYPVKASDCKYDAFKVRESEPPQPGARPLVVTKDAQGAYDLTYTWTITKDVDKTLVQTTASTATFHYTVIVDADDGTISNVTVSGTITVFNPNDATVHNVDVTDALSDGTVCAVTGGTDASVAPGETDFAYTCDLGGSLPAGQLDNTATVEWPEQVLSDGSDLPTGIGDFTFTDISFDGTTIDECVDVSDTFDGVPGNLGTVCVADTPKTFEYPRTVDVPRDICVSFDNTATFTTNDTGSTGSDSETVTVCGPITGGHTMGFWQNKNGQGIIKAGTSTLGVCDSGTWLRQYAPFQDLSATAGCNAVATYVTNVIKAASASGASMNKMLKGQMLATALSVYFSDPLLGGNQTGAPQALGPRLVDLELMGTSGGFGGATEMTVFQMLEYAASQSNVGGGVWYAQVKATQELAKIAFDTVNNNGAFAP